MDETSYFVKIPVVLTILLLGLWGLRVLLSAKSRSSGNTLIKSTAVPPQLPWESPEAMRRFEEGQLAQLPETVPLPADIKGENRSKIERHLGDKLRDKAFMYELRLELRRFGTLNDNELSVLEATLLGFVMGQADLHQFFGALEQADVVLLARPDKPGIPLAVEDEGGSPYLAVFTAIDRAILAIDHHETYRKAGSMKMLDVTDLFFDQLGLKQLGLWINPYDRVVTFRFNSEQARAFSKHVAKRLESRKQPRS